MLTPEEQSELRALLSNATLRKAVDLSLFRAWTKFPSSLDIASEALRGKYYEGAVEALEALWTEADAKPSQQVFSRKLRHNAGP